MKPSKKDWCCEAISSGPGQVLAPRNFDADRADPGEAGQNGPCPEFRVGQGQILVFHQADRNGSEAHEQGDPEKIEIEKDAAQNAHHAVLHTRKAVRTQGLSGAVQSFPAIRKAGEDADFRAEELVVLAEHQEQGPAGKAPEGRGNDRIGTRARSGATRWISRTARRIW